jgi:rfaE bifunctional protein kinase chain/domain
MSYKIKENIQILVIGDLMVDHYIHGDCNRISPEAPVQVVEVKRDIYTLGGAGNVLQNLIAFNCKTNIVSVTGNDDDARLITNQLEKEGIVDQFIIKDENRCTTLKSRVMVSNHQLIRIDRELTTPVDSFIVIKIIDELERIIKNYDVVLLSDYNKGLFSEDLLKHIFRICRIAGVKTIVDPKGNGFSKYKGVNIIKPNKKEATIASGIAIINRETLLAACIKIKEITGCDDVIITMSEDGIALYENETLSIIPTRALDVIDVTGAGDTVLAALGVSMASGNSLYNACDFANHAAAVVVNKVGSATATLDEVKAKFEN